MSALKSCKGLSLVSALASLLLISPAVFHPAFADDLEIGGPREDSPSDHFSLDDEEWDDEDVISSDPSGSACGETVENSRC